MIIYNKTQDKMRLFYLGFRYTKVLKWVLHDRVCPIMSLKRYVGKIVCIGRNYKAHAEELGNVLPATPFYFLKPPTSLLWPNAGPILRPKGTIVHHEIELALVIGKRLSMPEWPLSLESALDVVSDYALALDLTARNVQDEAKSKGLPWAIAKGFDTFCPISDYVPKSEVPDPHNLFLELRINDIVRQADSTSLMVHKIPDILWQISNVMTLEPGDLVLTGTPEGVSTLEPGDHVDGELRFGDKTLCELHLDVEAHPGAYNYEPAK